MSSQLSVVQVFVYGTLKPGESNYKNYCQGKTIAEIRAYTIGQLYHLAPGYPAMTKGNSKVEGYLLSFADKTILQSLDTLEGYSQYRAETLNEYNRQQIAVYSLSNKSLGTAWAYLMTKAKITALGGKRLNVTSWDYRFNL